MDVCSGLPLDGSYPNPPSFSTYWVDIFAVVGGQVVSLALVLSVLAVLPKEDYPLCQRAGARTLVPYVFHVAALILLKTYTTLADDDADAWNIFPLLMIVALWAMFLFIPIVNRVLILLVMPPILVKAKSA